MNRYLNSRNESTVLKLVQDSALKTKFQAIAHQEGRERAIKDCAKHAGVNINMMRAVAYYW